MQALFWKSRPMRYQTEIRRSQIENFTAQKFKETESITETFLDSDAE